MHILPVFFLFLFHAPASSLPELSKGQKLQAGGEVIDIEVADWNDDGKLDLLVGNYYTQRSRIPFTRETLGGNIWLYLGK